MLEMRRWDTSARQTFPVKHTSRIFKYLELIGYIEGLCGRFAGSSKHHSIRIPTQTERDVNVTGSGTETGVIYAYCRN
jgi:hypothetical protein